MKDVSILTNNGIDVKKSLELFGDMATYDQLLGDFLGEVDNKLQDAKKYKETADMTNYAVTVHSLKSDCRYFGINALADKFYEHELAGKENNFYFVTEHFEELMNSANHTLNILKKYMGIETAPETVTPNQVEGREAILVVDDSNIIRTFVEKIFDVKYEVLVANDGDEAISLMSSTSNIKCMFLDLNMPNVDGFQVLEFMRKNNMFTRIPVIPITGIEEEETIKKVYSYPIIAVLKKPFNEMTLRDAFLKAISRNR